MQIKFIKKRNNDVVDFDIIRIKNAIIKAYNSVNDIDVNQVDAILESVLQDVDDLFLKIDGDSIVTVENVQDIVEKNLMKAGKYEVAKSYIIYRQKHAEFRENELKQNIEKIDSKSLMVLKNDGTKEPFDISKIKKVYDRISLEYTQDCPFSLIEEKLKSYVVDGIKTTDITKLIVKTAIDLISVENIKWHFIAARFTTLDFYKKASKNRGINIDDIYTPESFKMHFDDYIKRGFYYYDFYKYYSEQDILEVGKYLNKTRDMEYGYTSVVAMGKRYLCNPNKIVRELPQEMYMAAALFLAIPEKKEERLDIALKIYEYCSSQKISLATSNLLNVRTNFHQLANCFKMSIDDDINSIYHCIHNMALISKTSGGIGAYIGHIRSKGASIRGIKGASAGVMPWTKVINDTAVAVNQLGSRAGSISVTLDIWHKDIYDFLDMQTETGDIRRKAFDIYPSVSVPDLFMNRVMEDGDWSLFDPKEVELIYGRRIENTWGDEFEQFYKELESDSRLTLKETVKAKELFKKFLKSVVETGMPYVFFRDTCNKLNPNKHAGMTYCSQLCTEIIQNISPSKFVEELQEDGTIIQKYKAGDTVVCNLSSINVAKVNTPEEIAKVIPIAIRILDNVIDLNLYPMKEAEYSCKRYRSIGLGFLGLSEYLAVNKIRYDSPEGAQHVDKLFEQYAYHTLKTSNELAKERGHYELFPGSDRSKGLLFGKDEKWYLNNSEIGYKWQELIAEIKKHGVRCSYHLSPAPNSSTSFVVGTTAGVVPIYKKYFVETNMLGSTVNVAPNLNKDNFWYYKEYVNMNMEDVIDVISSIQKWIDQSISFEWIINPANVSPQQIYNYYIKAWKQGIKTVYYVRSMSLDVKECVSCSG